MFKAPAIYFPSTVVLLDDDDLYAQILIKRLAINNLKYCESPDFLLKQKKDDFIFIDNDILKKNTTNEIEYIKQNLISLKKSAKLVSVLISDLHMKSMSGTDIFSEIASPHVGRILISNFIDFIEDNEIDDARNNDKIDIVLDKTNNFKVKLPAAIEAAKMKFFSSLSNELYAHAASCHPLCDKEFAKLFTLKISELKPTRITPNKALNKFVFEFANLKPNQVFHIAEPYEINSILTSSGAESAPPEVLKHLSTGKYILCHEDDEILLDGRLWPLHIRPAQEFRGQKLKLFYHFSESVNHEQRTHNEY